MMVAAYYPEVSKLVMRSLLGRTEAPSVSRGEFVEKTKREGFLFGLGFAVVGGWTKEPGDDSGAEYAFITEREG